MEKSKKILCPSCKEFRDSDLSGKLINEIGVCSYCFLYLTSVEAESSLFLVGKIITPTHVAKYIIDFCEKKQKNSEVFK